MSSLEVSDSVCMFCYRTYHVSHKINSSSRKLKYFVKNLGRFIGFVELENYMKKFEQSEKSFDFLLGSCVECQSLIDGFCEVYHKLKCLKLDLEWKLDKLVRIINLGSKVPSRVSTLNLVLTERFGEDVGNKADYEMQFQNFRNIVVKKGRERLKKYQPRVLIKTLPDLNASSNGVKLCSLNQNIIAYSNAKILENASSSLKDEQSTAVINFTEINDDGNDLSELGNYLHDTTDLVVDTSFDQLENDNQTILSKSVSMNFSNSENPRKLEIQMQDDDAMATDVQENILGDEIISRQPSSEVIPNQETCTATSSKDMKNIHEDPTRYSCNLINQRTELHDIPMTFGQVVTQVDCSVNNDTCTPNLLASSETSPLRQRYNLRDQQKSTTLNPNEMSGDLDDNDYHSSSSSATSDSSHEDETIEVMKTARRPYKKRVSVKAEKICGLDQFRCKICHRAFESRRKLIYHRGKCHNIKNLRLPNKVSTSQVASIKTNRLEDPSIILKCQFCETNFEHSHDLAEHEIEHAINPPITKGKKFKCPRCPFKYNVKGVYLKHHLKSHQNISPRNLPGACTLCSGESVYILNSRKHYNLYHNLKFLKSPNQVVKCDMCPAYFLENIQLYLHKTKIHMENNHKCDVCGKVFKTRRLFINHRRAVHKHADEDQTLPFGCDMEGCKRRYKSLGELDLHKRFHRNVTASIQKGPSDPNTSCLECGKICKTRTALSSHKNRVHREKKCVCEECGKAFCSNPTLKMHMEYHKDPIQWKFECTECGKKCAEKYKLEQHMRTHTKDKPWICQFCGEKYAHRHNWRNHLKTKHGDEEAALVVGGERNLKTSEAQYISRKGSKKGDCMLTGFSTKPNN